jgi:hypothetical protein
VLGKHRLAGSDSNLASWSLAVILQRSFAQLPVHIFPFEQNMKNCYSGIFPASRFAANEASCYQFLPCRIPGSRTQELPASTGANTWQGDKWWTKTGMTSNIHPFPN